MFIAVRTVRQTLSSISPGWAVMFLDSHRTMLTFLSWLDLLGAVLAFWICILNIFKSLTHYWHRVTVITSFKIHLENSSGHTLSFSPNLVKYRFTSILLWWSSLQTKECQMHSDFRLVGLKIVKSLRRRKYAPMIIERTIGLVLGPSTALYRSFLKHCTMTN